MASYINYLVNAQLIIQPDPLAMIMCSYIAQNRIGIIIQTRMMEVVCLCVCRQFCELLAGLTYEVKTLKPTIKCTINTPSISINSNLQASSGTQRRFTHCGVKTGNNWWITYSHPSHSLQRSETRSTWKTLCAVISLNRAKNLI